MCFALQKDKKYSEAADNSSSNLFCFTNIPSNMNSFYDNFKSFYSVYTCVLFLVGKAFYWIYIGVSVDLYYAQGYVLFCYSSIWNKCIG